MKRIASFTVDHRKISKGVYISRIDGDVVTYDVRMCVPNGGIYLENGAMHTIEHLFATFARNSALSDSVVYVGPMGCRTGFYLLVRDTMAHEQALKLLRDTFAFIAAFDGEIPGVSEPECGNWKEHDLQGAKAVAADFAGVLAQWGVERMTYPQ